MLVFLIVTCGSIMVIPSIEPGLDQKLSMAKESHVTKYFEVSFLGKLFPLNLFLKLNVNCCCFQFMEDILSMGPPVYFVIGPGLTYNNKTDQNDVCGGTLCDVNSIATKLYIASNYPES